ncbi:MAG: hypothetical protein LBH07_03955 [Treponema sp.]|jgi:tetratricopeptide (TPR) repeat protein|nr:hypothetical protein [Treponema sp.]
MKKPALFFVILLSLGTALGAQGNPGYYEVIFSEGAGVQERAEIAAAYSKELELRFNAYNSVFRFNPALLSSPLRVRIITGKSEYDTYISARLGSPRAGAVYLHYRSPANRELVIHRGSEEEQRLIPHQAFIQFLRAFIPDPPIWIREGFAVYFNTLFYDQAKQSLVHEENLNWLDTVKRISINPETVFLADSTFPNMQSSSWSLVSFFMADKNNVYYRSMTDSFMILAAGASARQNAQAVYQRLILFNPIADITRDYRTYIAGKKTFFELIEEGQKAYGDKNFAIAGDLFRKAAALKWDHFASYYYLGLLAYEDKKYIEAEAYYKTALDHGAENAMIQYARGVNAAAQGKKAEALVFLQEAAVAEKYRDRSNELIRRLQ